jgi:hypothetical protein
MARTVANVLSRVRETLQDLAGTRYPEPELIGYVSDAVIEARSIRPDLFIGAFGDALADPTDPAAPFPLPDQFFPAVCFYVCGRAELRDDEFAVDGRAMTLLSAYGKKLLAGA